MKNVITLIDSIPGIVADDKWILVNDAELCAGDNNRFILPLPLWLEYQKKMSAPEEKIYRHGVWLSSDDDIEMLQPFLKLLPIIAIHFPGFRDGRGYSQAYLLRTRAGWSGELRAVGDVLRDQLSHMRQCGFTSFAVREDKSVADALKGLMGISVTYGRSVIEPRPLFRRRQE